jgi:hypothetical protein
MTDQSNNLPQEKSHSRLGIASVVIALMLPALLILFLVMGLLLGSKKGSVGNLFGLGFIIISLVAPWLHLVGFVLGLIGWISKKTKKLFPAVGTILNAILGLSGLLIIYLFLANMSWGFR